MILGTRGSALALAQTRLVEAAWRAAHPGRPIRHEIIHTTGDLRQELRLGRPNADAGADKSVWTKELETALRDGRITAAVHSAKDVPADLPPGFTLAACLPRAAVADVLITKTPGGWVALREGAVIATSSVRRARLLRWNAPHLHTEEIRGNVPTRLRKLVEHPEWDGLVLARAGLDRLGYALADGRLVVPEEVTTQPLFAETLPEETFLPAASQGIVALEVFGDDLARDTALAALNHPPTWRALRAEREFLRRLGAGCHTPVGVLTRETGDTLSLRALVFPEDEHDPAPPCEGFAEGPAAAPERVAAQLLASLALAPVRVG